MAPPANCLFPGTCRERAHKGFGGKRTKTGTHLRRPEGPGSTWPGASAPGTESPPTMEPRRGERSREFCRPVGAQIIRGPGTVGLRPPLRSTGPSGRGHQNLYTPTANWRLDLGWVLPQTQRAVGGIARNLLFTCWGLINEYRHSSTSRGSRCSCCTAVYIRFCNHDKTGPVVRGGRTLF